MSVWRSGSGDGPREPILYRPPSRLALYDRHIAWGTFCLALLVRAAYLKQLHDSPLWDDLPVDLGYYRDWGMRIAAGDWTGSHVFEQSPLYAYFLAIMFKIFGPGLMAPRLVQILLGSLTCVLIYRTGRQLFSPPAGMVAGLMAALYGPFLFYDGMLMKEVFAVAFMTAMIYQLIVANGSQRGLLATAGVCLGLGALVRDNLILVAPAVALWLMLDPWLGGARMSRGRLGEGIGRVAAFGVGILLVAVPVAARNYHVSGELVPLTAGGGEAFYIGNNPAADGRYSPPPFVRAASSVEHEDFRREAARRLGRGVTRAESSGYWLKQGLDWIAANPRDYLSLLGRKLLIFWNHYELPDNHNYEHHRRLLPILQLPLLTFGWVVPLAAAGLALSAARWRDMIPLYLIGGGYAASVMLFFNFGRFRMPVVPVLLLFAGYAVVGIFEALAARRFVRGAAAVAAASFMVMVVTRDLEEDPVHLGQSHAQVGELLMRARRLQEADAESRESLRMLEDFYARMGGRLVKEGHGVPTAGQPGRPNLGESFYAVLGEAYRTRSEILRAQGKATESNLWARHAAAADGGAAGREAAGRAASRAGAGDLAGVPAEAAEMARLGQREMEARNFLAAAGAYEKALDAMPSEGKPGFDPRAHLRMSLHLAEALHRSGRPRDALAAVETALDQAPDLPPLDQADAHYGEALVYRDLGQPELMRFHLRECLRLNPVHPRAGWIRETLEDR